MGRRCNCEESIILYLIVNKAGRNFKRKWKGTYMHYVLIWWFKKRMTIALIFTFLLNLLQSNN